MADSPAAAVHDRRPAETALTARRDHAIPVWLLRLPVRVLDAALWVYQRSLSPALSALNPHCGCRFAPTCSHYAREALREHGLLAGVGLTVIRLAKCGPWHPGGHDPVPARARLVCSAVRRPS